MKRGPDGLARARRLASAARYYSFFTLDVSDLLDYRSLVGVTNVDPTGLEGKYSLALDAVEALYRTLLELKGDAPFDLELSIDEHPAGVNTFDCLTSPAELRFVLLELQRRRVPLTHVAPNLGIQKGVDYRGPDGLPGLEARNRALSRLAADLGVLLDVHSGDDLSAEHPPRPPPGDRRAAAFQDLAPAPVVVCGSPGRLSPRPFPALVGTSPGRLCPPRSRRRVGLCRPAAWLRRSKPTACRWRNDSVFHHFSFPFVGQRDAAGRFMRREEFYLLSPAFYAAYQAARGALPARIGSGSV